MVMRADQYKIISPGSPAPVSFGMGSNVSSMSLNPGTGSYGQIGDASSHFGSQLMNGGGGGVSVGGMGGGSGGNSLPSSVSVLPSHIQAPTLGTIQVNGYYGGGGADLGSLGGYYGLGGGGSVGGSQQGPGKLPVKNLAPMHVTAQLPRTPGAIEQGWMRLNDFQNDHPFAYHAAKTALGATGPILPTVYAIANAYQRWKHGGPLFGNMFGNLGGTVSGMFKDSPGGPLSSNDQNPLYKDLDSSFFDGSGSGATTGGGSQYYNSQLPDYPGLTGLSSYPLSGDPGGYWNQMALHAAAPTYGPFAGYGKKPLPIAPSGILGA